MSFLEILLFTNGNIEASCNNTSLSSPQGSSSLNHSTSQTSTHLLSQTQLLTSFKSLIRFLRTYAAIKLTRFNQSHSDSRTRHLFVAQTPSFSALQMVQLQLEKRLHSKLVKVCNHSDLTINRELHTLVCASVRWEQSLESKLKTKINTTL